MSSVQIRALPAPGLPIGCGLKGTFEIKTRASDRQGAMDSGIRTRASRRQRACRGPRADAGQRLAGRFSPPRLPPHPQAKGQSHVCLSGADAGCPGSVLREGPAAGPPWQRSPGDRWLQLSALHGGTSGLQGGGKWPSVVVRWLHPRPSTRVPPARGRRAAGALGVGSQHCRHEGST